MNTGMRVLALVALICAGANLASAQCAGFCGGNSGGCFCDDLCTQFQDCCPDVCETCNICGDGDSPFSDSCEGSCGQNAGLCWCDALCSTFGDCCDDACDFCDETNGGPSSCVSQGCSAADCDSTDPIGGCYCDELCTQFQDCCEDAQGFNSENGEGSACNVCGYCYVDDILSCEGFCGQNTGSCWCDQACTFFQDCCEDVQNFCDDVAVPSGCQGFCGAASTGCFCDALCTFYSDCCDDLEEQCPCVLNCGVDNAGSDGCSCADNCAATNSCCDDYEEACTVAGTCVGFCGGQNAAAGCFCDALCTTFDDCCDDAIDLCLTCTPAFCGLNTGACWCDELCSIYQDCCENACDACSNGCIADLECAANEILLTLTINPDDFPQEISYQILDTTNSQAGVVVQQAAYPGIPVQSCVGLGSTTLVSILDSFQDGFVPGGYTLTVGDSSQSGDGDIGGSVTWEVVVTAFGQIVLTQVETPCQQLLDCNDNCMGFQFANWVADGICDEGAFGEVTTADGLVGISLNCQKYAAEAADCQSSPNLASIAANIGTPEVSFPFDEGSGTTPVNQGTLAGDVAAELVGADWTFDTLLNKNVIECVKSENDLILISDFQYGQNFTAFIAFRHEDSPGELFEYLFSHGTATPSIFSENNFNIYFPEATHPASGIVRTALYDKNDGGQNVIYLDSDGQIADNEPRNIPGHVNVIDDSWHMMTVRKINQQGFSVFIDGRKYGELDGTKDIQGPPFKPTSSFGLQNVNPVGQIHLCGRSDKDPERHYDGLLAEFHMFTRPLSDIEILAFANTKGFAKTECPDGQLKDTCGVCGGPGGVIAPDSNSLCCEPVASPLDTNPDPNATVLGDVNSDGIYTVLDIIPLANYLLEISALTACQEVYGDINQDGSLSVTDVIVIAGQIAA